MRFAMTAKTLMRERATEGGVRAITARNVGKVTRYREGGVEELERAVRRLETGRGLGGRVGGGGGGGVVVGGKGDEERGVEGR